MPSCSLWRHCKTYSLWRDTMATCSIVTRIRTIIVIRLQIWPDPCIHTICSGNNAVTKPWLFCTKVQKIPIYLIRYQYKKYRTYFCYSHCFIVSLFITHNGKLGNNWWITIMTKSMARITTIAQWNLPAKERPVTWEWDVLFDDILNKLLNEQFNWR